MVRLGRPWTKKHEETRADDVDTILVNHIRSARTQGGATLDPVTGLNPVHPNTGYAVSIRRCEERFSAQNRTDAELARVVKRYVERTNGVTEPPFLYVGLWFTDGFIVLDRTAIVQTLRQAVGHALLEEQEAIFAFETGRVHNTRDVIEGVRLALFDSLRFNPDHQPQP